MKKLDQLFSRAAPRFAGMLRNGCGLLAALGVAMIPAGQALAQQYGQHFGGVTPVEEVQIVGIRQMERVVNPNAGGYNITGRVIGGVAGVAIADKWMGRGKGKDYAKIIVGAAGQSMGAGAQDAINEQRIPVAEFTIRGRNGQMAVLQQDVDSRIADCAVGSRAYLAGNQINRCLVASANYAQAPTAWRYPSGQDPKGWRVEANGDTFQFNSASEKAAFLMAAAEVKSIASSALSREDFSPDDRASIQAGLRDSLREAAARAGGRLVSTGAPERSKAPAPSEPGM